MSVRLPSEYLRQGWCQGAFAKDAGDRDCDCLARSGKAVAWCLEGSIYGSWLPFSNKFALFDWLWKRGLGRLSAWNDSPERTQAEVIAMMEMAETAVLGVVHVKEIT